MFCCCCIQRSSSFWYWHWLTLLDRGAHNCLKMGECSEVHRRDGRSKRLFETRSWTIYFFFKSIISFSLYEYLKLGEWWEVHWGYGRWRPKGRFEASSTSILNFFLFSSISFSLYIHEYLKMGACREVHRWDRPKVCLKPVPQLSSS